MQPYTADNKGSATPHPFRVLAGGVLGLMLAMGIGRFSFTPILPLMQRDLGVSNGLAGDLASLNYIGYLAGALLCAIYPKIVTRTSINLGVLLTSLATTLLMGCSSSPHLWGGLRFAAGVASAILFVLIAIEVTEALVHGQKGRFASLLYSGVGLGIAVSGIAVPLLDRLGGWQSAWFGMGGIGIILALAGLLLAGKHKGSVQLRETAAKTAEQPKGKITRLATAYFLEGVGYIVTATFLVTIVSGTAGLSSFAPLSWVVVGLAAAPSTLFWQQVANRFSFRIAITAAYLLQATGIAVSSFATTPLFVTVAALSFGGTFMGIVALAMTESSRRTGGGRSAAIMTACFGAGQVIAPPLAGRLADLYGGFTLPLLLASGVVLIGGLLVATDQGSR